MAEADRNMEVATPESQKTPSPTSPPAWLMGKREIASPQHPDKGSLSTTTGSQKTDVMTRWKSKMRRSAEALHCLEKGQGSCSSTALKCRDTALTFKDVNFSVKSREILAPVSGHFESGELVAIMGPSGCGKSTLLDILAGKKTGHYGGTIHFNGRPRDKLFHRVTAYVPQEDQMPKYLTVTEAVEFNGQLKFERPSEVSRTMRRQWLQRRLEVLGLENVKDTYIGDGTSLRGISGGQKRRLSLAKRLASGAQVFFCDEPTSGLSATDAESCIRYMKHTASYYNVLVLVVIHQPRIEVANLFDQLLLMTSNPGRIVYNGRMKDVVNYVEQVGFEVPRHANPVDFFMDLITPDTSTCQVEPFDQYYREHVAADVAKRVDEGLKAEMRSGLEILEEQRELLLQWGYVPAMRNSVYGVRFRKQLGIVFMRQLKLRIRDRRGILADLIGALAKAVVVGIVYMRTGELIAAQQVSFYFMLCMTCSIDGLKNMPTVIEERTVVKMEHSEVLYSDWAYIISFTFLNLLQSIFVHSLFVTILFSMSGLRWNLYGCIYLWSTLLAVTMDALYLMVAAVATNSASAIALSSPFMMLFLLFNGFTATRSSVVDWMRWAINISPVAYSIQQMTFGAQYVYRDDEKLSRGYANVIRASEYEDQPHTALAVYAVCFGTFKILQMICFHFLNNIKR